MSDSPLSMNLYAEDWLKRPLIKVSEFIKDGTHGTHERVNIGVPLLSAKNITSYGSITIDEEDSRISNDDYQKIHSKYEIQKNDLLITVVGTLGRRALADGVHKFSIQRSVGVVRCDTTKIFPEFLYHFTGSDYFQNQLTLRSNATAQAGVYLGELAKIDIAIPPLPEQQKIAAILTSVDTVIEKIRTQIDKLKHLKTGMMQELLTQGIGHTEFKDPPVGQIPKSWEVKEISHVCADIVDCVNKTAPVVDYPTPYRMIRTTNVRNGEIIMDGMRYVTEATFQNWSRRIILQDGDIIFTREAPVGECGILKNSKNLFLGQRTMVYRADESKINNLFLLATMQSEYFKSQIDDLSGGSTTPHLRVPDCSKILLKMPPIEEQEKIATAIRSIDTKIMATNQKLISVEQTKKALMQDLLTGKVRVILD